VNMHPDGRGGTAMRLRGLVRKEFFQILRDPSSIAIAFLMPVVLLLVFGYGVSLDADHIPVAVVTGQPGTDTADFVATLRHNRYFDLLPMSTMADAEAAMMAGRVNGIVHLQADFGRRLRASEGAPIQVIVNGVDANTGRIISGYMQGVWGQWLQQVTQARGERLDLPVDLQPRIWFNSELRSRNFLVPGLIAIIMTLIGAMLTALVMAREWERGTMEALMVTPVTIRELLLGKLIPYFILGMGGMALSVVMALFLFHVPLRGSLWLLTLTSALFLLVALAMGMLISIVAKNQFVAGQVALVVTFLPAFILSGFLFDIDSMPAVVQLLTHVIAARYFVAILQTIFMAGNVWPVILGNALALLVMGLLFFTVVRRRARKRLD
jgi:ABC-2 type transport system permease protein